MECLVSEKISVKSALAISDIASAATSWEDMKGRLKARFVVRVESAAADVVVTLREAKDAAGTDAQDLEIAAPAFYRVDGSDAVKVDESGIVSVTVTALNGAAGVVIVEVEGQDLSEGFSHVGLSINGGAARNGAVLIESETEYKPAYAQSL